MPVLDDAALDQLFRAARSQNGWTDEPVTDAQLHALYDLARLGPTSMNCCPARFVFVRSAEAKKRLEPALAPSNVAKINTAPVAVIIATDHAFYEQMPKLFPHFPGARDLFAGNPELAHITASRNGTLQGAYLLLAARAIGLDAGPISGFDNAKVDVAFFAGTSWKSNFIAGIGHGDPSKVFPRNPRLSFDEATRIE